jgi:O-acetylserine/cysteine efflux transporter
MFGLLFVAISWGMPGGLASLLAQMQVFFTIVMAAWLFHEIPRPVQIAGGLVALVGVGVIAAGKGETTALVPFLMIIAAAAAWGVANIIVKQARPTDMVGFVVWSSLVAPLPLFALSSAFEGTTFGLPAAMPSLTAIFSVLFLAWPTTVFAFGAWVTLLRRYPAATVTPFALLIPVFGFASTSIVFGEQLPAWVWAGSGLVFIGLGIIVMGPRLAASAIRLR